MKSNINNAFAISLFKKAVALVESKILDVKDSIEELRKLSENQMIGPAGKDGTNGKDGLPGKDGTDGKDGRDGVDGKDGKDGKDGLPGTNGKDGLPGKDGTDGKDGRDGKDGIDGKDGNDGVDGKDGKDGETGLPGKDGIDGKDGKDGLPGKDGKDGIDGKDGKDGLPGKDGKDGIDGKDGKDGLPGKDGTDGKDGLVPDISHLESRINEKLDTVSAEIESLIEINKKDFEGKGTEFEERFNESVSKLQNQITTKMNSLAMGSGGGGSVRILSMEDVEFKKRNEVEGESILVFNADSKKFVSESFLDVLNRLKADLEVQYDRLIDVDGSFTYIGEASPGTSKASPLWRIKRVNELNAEGDVEIIWADNSADFDKTWDDRAIYEYT
jgi:Ca2+-binding RTX toxin-like protein